MNLIKKIRDFFSSRIVKFFLFILFVGLIYFFLLEIYNTYLLHVSFWAPLIVSFIPFASLGVYMIVWIRKNWRDSLAYCKYNRWCPYLFCYDSEPKKADNIDMAEIKNSIREGDILLRCYTYYLDELIFSRNSFFTHCGIYYGTYKDKASQVLHATGDKGVHADSLERFCSCKDIVVLRFSYEKIEEEDKLHDIITNEPSKNSEKYEEEKDIRDRETVVFEELMERVKPGSYNSPAVMNNQDIKVFTKLVLDRARTLIDTPYDFKFDFEKFDKFSCIEYVWFCFKCLFPLHRIRVKDFEFFKIIVPVMIPDVFIKNDYFRHIYISIPKVTTKGDLKKYILPPRWQFERFYLAILLWGLVLLTAYDAFPFFMIYFFAPIFGIVILLNVIILSNFSSGSPRTSPDNLKVS